MGKWNNFFLQRMGEVSPGTPYPICESASTWGILCKTIPFKIIDKVKEPAKRSYHDEHGDDEYISPSGLFLEAYTMRVQFACKRIESDKYGSSVDDVRDKVGTFITYLRSAGMMKMYSSHTRIGRQNVRLSSISDNAVWLTDDDQEYLVFEVEFKVNDPITDIVLTTSSSSSSD